MTCTNYPSWIERAPEYMHEPLRAFHRWFIGEPDGVQADFNEVDLSDMDLALLHIFAKRGAKFTGSTILGVVQVKEPVVLQISPWPVLIMDTKVLLGCQPFDISHLPDLTNEEILSLDLQVDGQRVVEWWANNKEQIIQVAEEHHV